MSAVRNLLSDSPVSGIEAINPGTENGTIVLQLVTAFSTENNVPEAYEITPRRPGDIAACYANANKAKTLLKWEAKLGLKEMVIDTWNWQKNNPNGYH